MKSVIPRQLFVVACGLFLTGTLLAQNPAPKVKFPQPSPACTLTQMVGFTEVKIEYSRPSVRGRPVIGKMEPYGTVWRTGANDTTKITFGAPVKFGGTEVAAGTYALFSIPGQEEWTLIINKVAKWGAYTYDEKNDVVRVKAKAIHLQHPIETLTLDINAIRAGSATLVVTWEDSRVEFPFETNDVQKVNADIDAAIASGNADAGLYVNAAMFNFYNDLDLKKAGEWIDAGIAKRATFSTYYDKALICAKAGDKDGAVAAAKKSIELLANDKGPAREEYLRKNKMVIDSVSK